MSANIPTAAGAFRWADDDCESADIQLAPLGRNGIDITEQDLPEPGAALTAAESCGPGESTRTVTELIAPVTGQVDQINTAVVQDPSPIGASPYDAGWLFSVFGEDAGGLPTAAEYAQQVGLRS